LFQALTWPIREVSGGKVMLIRHGVGEAFLHQDQVALIAGLFVASPAVFTKSGNSSPRDCTRRSARWRSRSYFLRRLFCARRIFLLAVVSRLAMHFSISIREHRSHAHDSDKRVPVVLGQAAPGVALTFEMPIFAFFFTKLGMIDYKMMISYIRYAILAIFIVAAALTPPDMISQFLLAIHYCCSMRLKRSRAYAFVWKLRTRPAAAISNNPILSDLKGIENAHGDNPQFPLPAARLESRRDEPQPPRTRFAPPTRR